METNNKQRALQLHLDETLDVEYFTIEQAEDDNSLFNVDVVDIDDYDWGFDTNKKYLVLTECETEHRLDETLDNYGEEYIDNIPSEVKDSVRLVIGNSNYEKWKRTTKIEQTAAKSFGAVDEEGFCINYDGVKYNIYEIETGEKLWV